MRNARFARIAPALLAVCLSAAAAHAAQGKGGNAKGYYAPLLDASKAEEDAPEAIRENGAFCKQPSRPLSSHARQLCAIADKLPDCDGFRAACAQEQQPATPPPKEEPPSGLREAMRKIFGAVASVLVWLMIPALIVAILYPLITAILRARRDKDLSEKSPEDKSSEKPATAEDELLSEDDAALLLRRAEGHVQKGNLEAALFTYLNAALRALDQRGAIRIARYRTNGEYVRLCAEAPAKAPLFAIVRSVDRVQFGGAAATADMVSEAAARATALVRGPQVAPAGHAALAGPFVVLLLLAMAPLLAGCGRHFPGYGGRGADPAGREILSDLLHRQGITVGPLGSSLASIPLPEADDGKPSPAVLVDVDRVSLETPTEEHLMEWVRAGGFLILAGNPSDWPDDVGGISENAASNEIVVSFFDRRNFIREQRVKLLRPAAVRFKDARRGVLAETGDGKIYAVQETLGKGQVVAIASSDLLTNAQLAVPENAVAVVALLQYLDRKELLLASEEDGISPPSNPIVALERAGLGLALYHALAATLLLFAAVGVRLARARPSPPALRRAFTEHIEATGAFYHRKRAATHALSAYARYAEERIRQRLPRGGQDIGAWLAQRSGVSAEECAQIWKRATSTHAFTAPQGDELLVLKRLSAIVSAALRMGN